jgi:hypothetical protein
MCCWCSISCALLLEPLRWRCCASLLRSVVPWWLWLALVAALLSFGGLRADLRA